MLPPPTPPPRSFPQLETAVDAARVHPLFPRQPVLVRGAWLPTGECAMRLAAACMLIGCLPIEGSLLAGIGV